MSPTMESLLYLYILLVYPRLITCETISGVGTDLVWSDDHGLDMRGHCSFTFSVGFCGAFKLELYPEKTLSLPKYAIFINRFDLNMYEVGIKKHCDLLCNNHVSSTSRTSTPLISCTDSTWAPFWISWREGTVKLGRGHIVGHSVLKQITDSQFKHIDFVKMGADDTNTRASYMFEPRTGRPDNPDMTCRVEATTTAATSTEAATFPTDRRAPETTPPATITTGSGDPGRVSDDTTTSTAQPSEADDKMTPDNCDNARRPESENLKMVFEKAADGKTLSPSNPDVEDLDSATSGSCAELCASRQTCVLYSISSTGTCRITSACRPQVEDETGSAVLFLKYWG